MFKESQPQQKPELTPEQLAEHPIAKKMFRQFTVFKEMYNEAKEKDKKTLRDRFVEVVEGSEELTNLILTSDRVDGPEFVLALMQNDAIKQGLRLLLAGYEQSRDKLVGIFTYDLEDIDGGKRAILHVPPYPDELTLKDVQDSFRLLAERVEADSSIVRIDGYSVLLGRKAVQNLLPSDAETVPAKSKADDEPGLSGGQRAALLYNASMLREYLSNGVKPQSVGKVMSRESFLKHFLKEE